MEFRNWLKYVMRNKYHAIKTNPFWTGVLICLVLGVVETIAFNIHIPVAGDFPFVMQIFLNLALIWILGMVNFIFLFIGYLFYEAISSSYDSYLREKYPKKKNKVKPKVKDTNPSRRREKDDKKEHESSYIPYDL